jgi:hypothetical protein
MPSLLEQGLDKAAVEALGGRLITVRGHHPFVLEDTEKMWVVYQGSMAVMTSRVAKGLAVGPRRSLFTANEGGVLFPVADRGTDVSERLIVLAIDTLVLIEAPLRRANEVLQAVGTSLQQALENWVLKLSEFAADGQAFLVADRFPKDGKFSLPDDMIVRVDREKVAWIQVEDGDLQLLGEPSLRIGKLPFPIPIGAELWLRTVGEVRIFVRSASDGDDPLDLIRGLSLFNSLLQRRIQMLEQQEDDIERDRLRRSDERDSAQFSNALHRMAQVLHPADAVPVFDDPLLAAASIVGEKLGLSVRPPAKSENMRRVKDPIEAIARATRVRHRTVILAGDWWNHDNGPLIAYRGAQGSPVALVRHELRGYQLIDPVRGESLQLTAELAAELEPKGVMFYRRLPESIKVAWRIPRWAMQGRLVDVCFIIGLSLAITLIGMLVPQATALIMDNAIPDANTRLLSELGLALVGAAFGTALFAFAQGIVSIRTGITTDAVSQAGVWDRLLSLKMPIFRKFTNGDLLDRAMAVSQVNRELNGQTLRSLLTSLLALLNLGLLYYYNSSRATLTIAS